MKLGTCETFTLDLRIYKTNKIRQFRYYPIESSPRKNKRPPFVSVSKISVSTHRPYKQTIRYITTVRNNGDLVIHQRATTKTPPSASGPRASRPTAHCAGNGASPTIWDYPTKRADRYNWRAGGVRAPTASTSKAPAPAAADDAGTNCWLDGLCNEAARRAGREKNEREHAPENRRWEAGRPRVRDDRVRFDSSPPGHEPRSRGVTSGIRKQLTYRRREH
ncbi:hypothetical protein EVAR_46732_1 [Eumeta japonica]|uniref:Uncharacterized protein n=1 Tax=Eumeta variegata TaxID=151549 RepID=A0A4C1XBE1_EUMVA|nr:hypothetical protein EVAR_46732_1 [Eumeta japonica]